MGNCNCNNECRYNEENGEFIFNPKIVIKIDDEILDILNNFYGQDVNNKEINKRYNIETSDKLDRIIDKIVIGSINDEDLYINKKEIDIIYMIDSTHSMGKETKIASTLSYNNSVNLKKTYPHYNFRFGIIFYNDPIDVTTNTNGFKQLTENLEDIKSFCDNWETQAGGDEAEDWVGGYTIALEKINWRNKEKIIVHICDAPAHGKKYSNGIGDNHGDTKFEEQLDNIMKRCAKENIKIIGLPKKLHAKKCFIECKNIYDSEDGPLFLVRTYNDSEIELDNLFN